jgi:dolichol-phosphate mannosyltransferase
VDRAEPRTLVAIATYNERDNLAPLIKEIHHFAPQVDVLVTDDNSPDGTGAVADELAKADLRVHVLHRAGKLGLGTAILAGMNYSIENNFDVHVTMDADFSHHPRDLPALLTGMRDHDIMIGSRYIPGGGTVNWPLSRKVMSWAVNFMCRLLMHLPARDASGGYRAYSVPLLRKTDLSHMLSHGYSFQEEVLLLCHLQGARVGETPIIFEDRRAGGSKANWKEIVRSMWILLRLGFRTALGLKPRK